MPSSPSANGTNRARIRARINSLDFMKAPIRDSRALHREQQASANLLFYLTLLRRKVSGADNLGLRSVIIQSFNHRDTETQRIIGFVKTKREGFAKQAGFLCVSVS